MFTLLCHRFSSITTREPCEKLRSLFPGLSVDFIRIDFWKFGGRINKNHISHHHEEVKQILPRHVICYQNCSPAFDVRFQEEKLPLGVLVSSLPVEVV